MQRLYYPKLRISNYLFVLSWSIAFSLVVNLLIYFKYNCLEIICGPYLDLESIFSLKFFFNSIGCSSLRYFDHFFTSYDFRLSFLLNLSLIYLELVSYFVFFSLNLRMESPILNSYLRRNYLFNQRPIYLLGLGLDYFTVPVINLGNSTKNLKLLSEGKLFSLRNLILNDFLSPSFINFKFNIFDKPAFFFGSSISKGFDFNSIFGVFYSLIFKLISPSVDWRFLNFISIFLGKINFSELIHSQFNVKENFNNYKKTFYYLLSADLNLPLKYSDFSIYQGFFRTNSFVYKRANLILPVTLFVERNGTYINLEGRLRATKRILTPFSFLLSDFSIMKGLIFMKRFLWPSNFSIFPLFNKILSNFFYLFLYTFDFFMKRSLYYISSFLLSGYFLNELVNIEFFSFDFLLIYEFYSLFIFSFFNSIFIRAIHNYYSFDIFSKNSRTLSLCAIKVKFHNFN